ncbi:MAG: peptidoglycan editing factor PgeF [Pseudoalteromonas sp.]|uniref:peptidoglycan editing factor PgeF n=1 Tax=unclassified Pseudoalteromonas TaxID=194690 RepID=UPI003F967C1F
MNLTPTWPAPQNIGALSTTRKGGDSQPPFASLNLGLHVGDNPNTVNSNRAVLTAQLPALPVWLNQVHSGDVINVDKHFDKTCLYDADALFTRVKNQPLAIMTADCLPILLATRCGSEIAAIHGGWRGLSAGIINNTLAQFSVERADIIAWLGPAIGAGNFEVGSEVKAIFEAEHSSHQAAFIAEPNDKFLADIYSIAKQQLNLLGVKDVFGGEYCTVSQSELFFSYRRDGQTGRMASVIWRK